MSSNSSDFSKAFPSSPARPDMSLPFAIDEMDFSVWYKNLANLNDFHKCKKIFEVLQTLNKAYPAKNNQIPGRTRLFFLEKLGSVLDSATRMLTHLPSTTENTATPFAIADEAERVNLSVWSSLELANAYLLLCQEHAFQQDDYYSLAEKTTVTTNGIRALGHALLYIFQTYSVPNVDFWPLCYLFYGLVQRHELTDSQHNPDAACIDNEFKRILVFSLSNTNQFSPQEMQTIYDLLGFYSSYASLLTLVPKKKFQGIPMINLKGTQPPKINEDENPEHNPDCFYIATVNVASKILEATFDKRAHHVPTDRLMLMRLAKTLTLNKQRKDPRSAAKGNQVGMMGFDHIVEYLNNKAAEKDQLGTSNLALTPQQHSEGRNLSLELSALEKQPGLTGSDEFDFEKTVPHSFQVVEFTDPTSIWQAHSEHKENYNDGIKLQLLDQSTKGFGLLWTEKLIKPKVGNIIGILHKSLTIGLIRWLAQSKETGMFMGVEILGTNAATVKISNPGFPDQQIVAIYLPAGETTKQYASLIIIPQKDFQPSEFIFLSKNNKTVRYRQTKQLQLTSFMYHVEIVRSF